MYRSGVAVLMLATGCLLRPDPPGGAGGDAGSGAADGGLDALPTSVNVMFVTSELARPSALTEAQADAKCAALATLVGLPPNTYVAWFATQGNPPSGRMRGARGWVRTDGRPFADTLDSLAAGAVFYPPALDEQGLLIPALATVATGVSGDGTVGSTCADGTGSNTVTSGFARSGTSFWTSGAGAVPCTSDQHLYCFGTNHQTPVVPPPPGATKLAFLSTTIGVGSGRAALDLQCHDDVSGTANSSRPFLAFVAISTESMAARFTDHGPRARLDGVIVTTDLTKFGQRPALDAPLDQLANLAYQAGLVATGASSPITTAVGLDSCFDWTNSSTAEKPMVGSAAHVGPEALNAGKSPTCGAKQRVYCIEE